MSPPQHHVLPRPRLRRPSPRNLRDAISDGAVVTGRNLRHFIRQPSLLIFSTIQPVTPVDLTGENDEDSEG